MFSGNPGFAQTTRLPKPLSRRRPREHYSGQRGWKRLQKVSSLYNHPAIALILTFSPREKEPHLPFLSHWERRTRSASEGREWIRRDRSTVTGGARLCRAEAAIRYSILSCFSPTGTDGEAAVKEPEGVGRDHLSRFLSHWERRTRSASEGTGVGYGRGLGLRVLRFLPPVLKRNRLADFRNALLRPDLALF